MALQFAKKHWALSHITLLLILLLVIFQLTQITQAKNSVTFLNIGQGDAILIQTKEGKNVLIDTGPDGKVVEQLSQKLNFFNQKIDLFILTHPDLDHYGGILDVMQKYPIKEVMLTGVSSSSNLYLAFLETLKTRNIPIVYPNSDNDLQIGSELYLDFLYPFKGQSLVGQEVNNKNDTSVSILVKDKSGKGQVLLTGDAEEKEEIDLLLSGQDFYSDIFKAGHHGSKTSSGQNFLDAIQPEIVVVSAGKDNKFGHPHPEVIERMSDKVIRSTAEEGPISFVIE